MVQAGDDSFAGRGLSLARTHVTLYPIGAIVAALLVGHTAGALLHGAMRLPLVTHPDERDWNSLGVTVGSAVLGVGITALIGLTCGWTLGVPVLVGGALVGGLPRALEWLAAKK